jgi:hypothetical protein
MPFPDLFKRVAIPLIIILAITAIVFGLKLLPRDRTVTISYNRSTVPQVGCPQSEFGCVYPFASPDCGAMETSTSSKPCKPSTMQSDV